MAITSQVLYILASGAERAKERLTVTTNNIANVNTPGFKKILMEEFSQHIPDNKGDSYNLMVFPRFKRTDVILTQGGLHKTGNPLDVALNGRGFFAVKAGNEEVYTRNGHFFINSDGKLVDQNGNPVLDISGKEIFLDGKKEVTITKDGEIFQGGEKVAVLKIVDFQTVKPLGNSYYQGIGSPTATDAEVLQGFLEDSNVNVVKEMVNLIENQRRFEMYGNVIRAIDQMNNRSNEIGKV